MHSELAFEFVMIAWSLEMSKTLHSDLPVSTFIPERNTKNKGAMSWENLSSGFPTR